MVTCSLGVPAGVMVLLDWLHQLEWQMSPLEDPCLSAPPFLRRRGNTSSLLTAPLHSLPAGVASLQQAGQFSLPNTGELRHMPPSSPVAFLECLNRQRWNQMVARSSS